MPSANAAVDDIMMATVTGKSFIPTSIPRVLLAQPQKFLGTSGGANDKPQGYGTKSSTIDSSSITSEGRYG